MVVVEKLRSRQTKLIDPTGEEYQFIAGEGTKAWLSHLGPSAPKPDLVIDESQLQTWTVDSVETDITAQCQLVWDNALNEFILYRGAAKVSSQPGNYSVTGMQVFLKPVRP